ncbi:tetratricopeptide repeat protein [Streptomyces actinomycinicus]|uniref:Tetratricopeptide repeat protein n=1 Tax=Streptomyces actinomycinicus TaxID=1695166 RepID=A0A937EHB9_9ACTN|nr:FxSxx-COOH system tetratricopeptide repeat protein [Streptomyces actinomycinicus]MBL1083103.1 tetratricopeptide repeat protein [Streptomyces actinomycinicus]
MTDGYGPGEGDPRATGPRSVAVGGGVGVAITGDGAQVVMLPPEAVRWAKDVEAPPGAGNLPGSASGVFVGRRDELAELRRLLTSGGEAAVTQVSGMRAIHGLGGIGKSTLALRYAHTFRRSYALVWWINAVSTEQIVSGLAGLATRLCPQWAATAGVQERAAWSILWLQWHPGWLLVFDNVEDPADLRHYLGSLPDGHHLATSRTATGWHAIAPSMPLGLLDPDAAVTLLCTLSLGPGHVPTARQRQDAAALAADLGRLPLALEQAGAYLFETGTSMADYRDMLGQVMDTAAGGIDPERTIARIWRHTLTAIERRNPQALTLLHAMAWLAPDAVPRIVLASLVPDPLALGKALGALHAYNMVSFTQDRGASMHRLVQAVLRNAPVAGDGTGPRGRREAERAVCRILPQEQDVKAEQAGPWERLLPHVMALVESAPPGHLPSSEATDGYYAAAQYLYRQGREAQAVPLRQAILDHHVRTLGQDHQETLVSRHNLAYACREAGDLRRAVTLFEDTLARRVRVTGDTHTGTLITRNQLALTYQESGDLQRAMAMFEATLAQQVRTLGETHRDTLVTRHNLACAYRKAGDVQRAIALFETTLAQEIQALGDAYPDTLITRNQLATTYQEAGELRRAMALFEATLAQQVQTRGETHPDTLVTRHNLACACREAGDLERAIALFEVTLAQRVQVLGDTHPETLITRNQFGVTYQEAGDLQRAMALYETTLAQQVQTLGDTHPDTLVTRHNLASAHRETGDLRRAIALFETTLAQRLQIMGETHPETQVTRRQLDYTYREAEVLERGGTAAPPSEAAPRRPDAEAGTG